LRFTIIDPVKAPDLTILPGSNSISIFSDHSNLSLSGTSLVPAPTLTAPVNIVGVPLPVELVGFSAVTKGRSVELNWSTATETKNSGFDVERCITGTKATAWEKVTFIKGHGTTAEPQTYSYRDVVKTGAKYAYRLKQIDNDGKFKYSKEVEAVIALSAEDYALSTNFPNPFNPTTTFRFAVKKAERVAVKVFNTLGQEVRTLFNEVAAPDQIYDLSFDATGLASGTYIYMLKTQDRFEVKKMVLMK
jgi:hypothetical protein